MRILNECSERDCILFIVLLYTALRISGILRIRVENVKKGYLNIREQKISKFRCIYLHRELRGALRSFIADKEPHAFLIKSCEGGKHPYLSCNGL